MWWTNQYKQQIDYSNLRTKLISSFRVSAMTTCFNLLWYTGCPRKIDTVKFGYFTIEGAFSTKSFFSWNWRLIVKLHKNRITFWITFFIFDIIHFEFAAAFFLNISPINHFNPNIVIFNCTLWYKVSFGILFCI